MSVTDDVRGGAGLGAPWPPDGQRRPDRPFRQDGAGRFDSPQPAEGTFEKTPPQDIAAEQCVLGGMLLSKDAIADVVEILKASDFYRPAHAIIFEAILDLYGRGEPADAITVAAALADSGDLNRVGGAPYLHTLIASVPTAANAAYYARIVGERAVLRRLVEAGTKIVQLGYGAASGGGRDVDDVVDLAQQTIYEVTERRVSEDFAVLADLLQPTLDEIEAVGAQGGVMSGVPTGFTDLDRLLNGLHPGQLIVVAGRPGLGKALALDTPLPTPDGWTTMGEVRAGDWLVGADGRPTRVLHAFDVMYDRPCYEVRFSDGSVIVADADHLWKVVSVAREPLSVGHGPASVHRGAAEQTLTTEQIRDTLRSGDGGPRYAVPDTAPLQLPERDLKVPPYRLGTWLGGGRRAKRRRTQAVRLGRARDVGVPRAGQIPRDYLRASERQRRALLAGLLDSAGTVTACGEVRYETASRRLADDVFELVVSLGYRCSLTRTTVVGTPTAGPAPTRPTAARTRRGRGVPAPVVYRLTFAAGDEVFRCDRKRSLHQARRDVAASTPADPRHIVDVRPVPSVPVRCVTVDNPDHLYLAGRAMVPTHNSTASMDFARNAAIRHNHASAIFSLEMSKVEIVMRLLSAEARVPLHVLRSGQLSDDDWTKLARCMGEISEAPLFVDDTPNMNLMEIRAKARRLKQRHDLKLIVVDYLQLMTTPKRVESRQQEVAELSRGLKLLAKEVECPVIAVSQLNRGPEQRTDKRPQLSDLRESGCLTADTRVVRADTNAEVTLGELLASGARNIPVWALDERLRYAPHTMTHVFPSGRRETFRMTLASGKSIDATANHPFLTVDGWRPLGELAPGVRIATPRHVPPPLAPRPQSEIELSALAAAAVAGTRLSDEVFALPKQQLTFFLRELWAISGGVTEASAGRPGQLHLESTSRRVLEDVSRLLLRYGITARLTDEPPIDDPSSARPARDASRARPTHRLVVGERDDQLRFLREIGVPGLRSAAAERLRAELERSGADRGGTVPSQVWDRVRAALVEPAVALAGHGTAHRPVSEAHRPVSEAPRLARVATVLDEAELELHATNDVQWDEIVSISSLGEREVYDASVPGAYNFIANGIATHNSIEQDADVVILLHRDDYYDKESPRAGEADFIVAKHRNGPTDTITVAAQLHLSRFVDMAVV